MQNQIPKNWQELRFGEVATLHRGYDLPVEKMTAGDYPVIFSNGKIEYHNQYKIKGPGVVTGRSGSLGNTFYIGEDYWPHNTTLYVSNFHGNNPKFVYYLLKTLNFSFLNAGSGVPTLNRNHVHEIPLKIPVDPGIQKQIAVTLSAFDDKIKVNNKIAKTLEEMTQALFKEWFVKFKFPGHKKVEFVDNELGKTPRGWEMGSVKDFFSVVLGGTPSRTNSNYWNGKVPWINSGEVNNFRVIEASEYITEEGLKKSNARIIPKGTTLIAITGATLGQVSLSEIELCANQSVVGVYDPQKILNNFIYLNIKARIKELIGGAGGGAQQHINKEIVENFSFSIPEITIVNQFLQIIDPIFNQIGVIMFENQKLAALRDLLLPKLMRGEVKV